MKSLDEQREYEREYDYYNDFNISNLDIDLLQVQITKIVTTLFAFIISVTELSEYVSKRKEESESF